MISELIESFRSVNSNAKSPTQIFSMRSAILRSMVRFPPLLCLLTGLIVSENVFGGSLETSVSRYPLQSQDVLKHIISEHDRGNAHPTFALSIDSETTVEVTQSQDAILPTARYSIHDRESRQVGHLGYYHLVSTKVDEFVLLTVNRGSGEVRGTVKKFDEEWLLVNNENIGFRNNAMDHISDEDVYYGRQLQAFHSDYMYQIDLHLDFDYELVKINGGSLCNVFNYINALITAANVVLERELLTHINVKHAKQTDFYDNVYSTSDALAKMKRDTEDVEWQREGIDLHYALLGKKLVGGLVDRSGIAFIENSLCDSTKGFSVVSGLEGGFDRLDESLGTDLKKFMYAIG